MWGAHALPVHHCLLGLVGGAALNQVVQQLVAQVTLVVGLAVIHASTPRADKLAALAPVACFYAELAHLGQSGVVGVAHALALLLVHPQRGAQVGHPASVHDAKARNLHVLTRHVYAQKLLYHLLHGNVGVGGGVEAESVEQPTLGKVSHDAHLLRAKVSLEPHVPLLRQEVASHNHGWGQPLRDHQRLKLVWRVLQIWVVAGHAPRAGAGHVVVRALVGAHLVPLWVQPPLLSAGLFQPGQGKRPQARRQHAPVGKVGQQRGVFDASYKVFTARRPAARSR